MKMAGHWIQGEKGLTKKPEVIRIARALNATPQHAAACCMLVWEWAEDSTETGSIPGIVPGDVSGIVGAPGVGEAMAAAGWIVETGDGITFPNWDRHNSEPSKRRAIAAHYMRAYRRERKRNNLTNKLQA